MVKPAPTEKTVPQTDPVLATPATPATLDAQADAPLNLEDDIARIRAARESQPFGAFDQKMTLPPIEGYHSHWFNDKPGRVDIAKRAGWTHINNPDGTPRMLVVDSGGLKAYAMKIPQQFWDEDQARQQAKADAALAAVKKKPDAAGIPIKPSDKGTFYTPEGKADAATFSR